MAGRGTRSRQRRRLYGHARRDRVRQRRIQRQVHASVRGRIVGVGDNGGSAVHEIPMARPCAGRRKRRARNLLGNENGSMMRGRRLLTPIGDLGMDETLYKVGGGGARLLTVIPGSIQAGHTSRVRLFGMNLPASVNAGAISLGRGIKINSVTRADDNTLLAEVSADANAAVGPRKAAITGVAGAQAMYLYKTVDYIAITPERGYGRPGGTRGPKVNQQFEADGFTHGPDGKPVNIGRVGPLKWDVAERVSRISDDDALYCGNVN